MKSSKAMAKENLKVLGINVLVKDIKAVEYYGPYEIPGVGTRSLTVVTTKDGKEYAYFSNLASKLWIAERDKERGEIWGYTAGEEFTK